jgi:hypothetical protein
MRLITLAVLAVLPVLGTTIDISAIPLQGTGYLSSGDAGPLAHGIRLDAYGAVGGVSVSMILNTTFAVAGYCCVAPGNLSGSASITTPTDSYVSPYFTFVPGASGSLTLQTSTGATIVSVPTDAVFILGPKIGDNRDWTQAVTVTHAPEPTTLLLSGTALLVVVLWRKRVALAN